MSVLDKGVTWFYKIKYVVGKEDDINLNAWDYVIKVPLWQAQGLERGV